MGPRLSRVAALTVAAVAVTLLTTEPGFAALMTRAYSFNAAGFTDSLGGTPDPAPTDPVVGTVTVAFDENVSNAATLVDAIGLTIGGHVYSAADVSFDYNSASFSGLMNIGSGAIGSTTPGTDDFFLKFTNVKTANPTLFSMSYTSQIDPTPQDADNWIAATGSVQEVPAVPEPAGLSLLALGGLGVLSRRKRS